ncbi:MAG TPA: hypothetical protein VMG12_38830 [Polyangiaceae bacterium]|nr:hypothetical protein [Polyangiaceae bacterium]
MNADGTVLVVSSGQPPIRAQLAGTIDERQLACAQREGHFAVLAFPRGAGDPMVLALSPAPPPASREPREDGAPEPEPSVDGDAIQMSVDGKRLRIRAEDEIVFECGKASVTLRRNGKVVIRGTHVETSSEGTNRIKGGQVRIN